MVSSNSAQELFHSDQGVRLAIQWKTTDVIDVTVKLLESEVHFLLKFDDRN